jgi:hypothetical protein
MNGIWVRSQDRNGPWGCDGFKREKRSNGTWDVVGYNVSTHAQLGNYPTEARALEVLDEIEQFRTGTVRARVKRWNNAKEVVDKFEEFHYDPERDTYHMPKE